MIYEGKGAWYTRLARRLSMDGLRKKIGTRNRCGGTNSDTGWITQSAEPSRNMRATPRHQRSGAGGVRAAVARRHAAAHGGSIPEPRRRRRRHRDGGRVLGAVGRHLRARSAMPMFQALKACPDAAVVQPDMNKYAAVAQQSGRQRDVGYIRPIVTVATATATGWIDILISSWPMSKRSSATDIASPPSVTTAVT